MAPSPFSSACLLLLSLLLLVVVVRGEQRDLFNDIRFNKVDELTEALKDPELNLNVKNAGGQTPLMNAVLEGRTDIVRLLLADKRANVAIGEMNGYTPMHGAAFQGRAEIAQMLVDRGLDINEVHLDGYTPLHRVTWGNEQRHLETLKVFLANGANPLLESSRGQVARETITDIGEVGESMRVLLLEAEQKAREALGGSEGTVEQE
eukprot:TRINITY_DN12796_c0_g1_i1.p1 TRINITY_DN12796_c0_g1~~TRINITY_DN12796_c0_g1_i1.p1  ORF type:complete len:218 (-),score=30.68 TRINITY_DN12796_c0_g1_i1:6-623(-)